MAIFRILGAGHSAGQRFMAFCRSRKNFYCYRRQAIFMVLINVFLGQLHCSLQHYMVAQPFIYFGKCVQF